MVPREVFSTNPDRMRAATASLAVVFCHPANLSGIGLVWPGEQVRALGTAAVEGDAGRQDPRSACKGRLGDSMLLLPSPPPPSAEAATSNAAGDKEARL